MPTDPNNNSIDNIAIALIKFAAETNTLGFRINLIKALRSAANITLIEARNYIDIHLTINRTRAWLATIDASLLSIGEANTIYLHIGNTHRFVGYLTDPVESLTSSILTESDLIIRGALNSAPPATNTADSDSDSDSIFLAHRPA